MWLHLTVQWSIILVKIYIYATWQSQSYDCNGIYGRYFVSNSMLSMSQFACMYLALSLSFQELYSIAFIPQPLLPSHLVNNKVDTTQTQVRSVSMENCIKLIEYNHAEIKTNKKWSLCNCLMRGVEHTNNSAQSKKIVFPL